MYFEDRVFHEFAGNCFTEIFHFYINELQYSEEYTDIFLEEYANHYTSFDAKSMDYNFFKFLKWKRHRKFSWIYASDIWL